ncbi:MAG: TldD/PmbA family protein [bacterium]
MNFIDLKPYVSYLGDYTDLRVEEVNFSLLEMTNGDIAQNYTTTTRGVSARSYEKGVGGFASQSELSESSIKKTIEQSIANARFLSKKEKLSDKKLPGEAAFSNVDLSDRKSKFSRKELIDFACQIDNYIEQKYPQLVTRKIFHHQHNMSKNFLNSIGSSLNYFLPRNIISIALSGENKTNKDKVVFSLNGFGDEETINNPESIYPEIDKHYEHLRRKLEGIYPEVGEHECILDSNLIGVFAHETVGHTTEGDIVKNGSIAGEYLNQPVASSLVSIVDFANTAFGKLCPVPVFVDDEGTKAEDVILIEKGILKNYLHNKETADYFNTKSTGNARALYYHEQPLVRMRNTVILPGKSKLEDMISSIDKGYYLITKRSGEADSTSEFMVGISLGYEIVNGKLGRGLKDTIITGIAFDMMKTVTAVSDEMTWSKGSGCGKNGYYMIVDHGGPSIKCRIKVGGR